MCHVAILLANGFEECEGLMVVDLLRRANISIDMVSIYDSLDITTSHHIALKADQSINNVAVTDYDYLVIPGGKGGVDELNNSTVAKEWITYFMNHDLPVAAVCAGPSVLGRLGFLEDRIFTCYPGFEQYCVNGKYTGTKCEKSGKVITARGLGAEFEFVHAILTDIAGSEVCNDVFKAIQY